jgi:short-subunit dehydrogenase
VADDVGVTVVHPGGIRTRIAETARVAAAASAAEEAAGKAAFARLLTYPPERAAEQIVAAVEHRRPRLLIALSARIPDVIARMAPARYPALLSIVQRLQNREH